MLTFVLSIGVSELEQASSGASGTEELRRLGKNVNGYLGETIDLPSVLQDCLAAAQVHGWAVKEIPVSEELSLPVFTRTALARSGTEAGTSRTRASRSLTAWWKRCGDCKSASTWASTRLEAVGSILTRAACP